MFILAGCKHTSCLVAGCFGERRVGGDYISGKRQARNPITGWHDLHGDSRYRQCAQKDRGGCKGRADQARREQPRSVQATPEQDARYCEDQQRARQRIRQQYPDIGHARPFVKVGQCRPSIGLFLLDMRFRVPSPMLRCQA